MEVFGITNDSKYQARKDQKLAFYREHNIPCWQWTPGDDDNIPSFPGLKQSNT
jgi:hypothetical protein